MLKKIGAISLLSASLVACGSGSNSSRAPVDPNLAYGNLQGQAVPYTGSLMPIYSNPLALQGYILTNSSLSAQLGGFNSFGICNGLDQTIVSGTALCHSNESAISNNPQFSTVFSSGTNVTNFVAAAATINNITGVQPYRILYDTNGGPYQFAGGANNTQTVSAAVLVPERNGAPLPANEIKGVLLYYHPTILSKGGVPSDFDGTLTPNLTSNDTATVTATNAITSFVENAMLAAVFATQGYVVVAPDYVGQGANYQVQHPYVIYGQTNAQTGLNALKAARTALSGVGLNLPTPTKLYISSYSEGGSYALWASFLAQTTYADYLAQNGFTLRRTVGASGAYDLTDATLQYEFANASNSLNPESNVWNVSPGLIPGTTPPESSQQVLGAAKAIAAINQAASKTALAGYVLTALAYYNSSSAALNVLAPNFAPMKTCIGWVISNNSGTYPESGTITPQQSYTNCPFPYDLAATYNTSGLTQTNVADQAFAAAQYLPISGPSEFLSGGMTYYHLVLNLALGYTNNSVGSFIEPGILTDPTIIPFVAQSNIQAWKTTSPLEILFLNYDSTVSNINALEACGNLPSSANFPGYQPGYTGGVKAQSSAGMVNCINLANNGISGTLPQLYTEQSGVPLMVDHGQAEVFLQILALNQILANP